MHHQPSKTPWRTWGRNGCVPRFGLIEWNGAKAITIMVRSTLLIVPLRRPSAIENKARMRASSTGSTLPCHFGGVAERERVAPRSWRSFRRRAVEGGVAGCRRALRLPPRLPMTRENPSRCPSPSVGLFWHACIHPLQTNHSSLKKQPAQQGLYCFVPSELR